MTDEEHGWLPRLQAGSYHGHAVVFWTFTVQDRATGWLSQAFHQQFREILLHACHRYHLVCPAYVLMPDHLHLLMLGLSTHSTQRKAITFLRTHAVPPRHHWQKQAYDHVLREQDRNPAAFQKIAHYLLANPERKALVEQAADWEYSGCLLPGYPRLRPHDAGYWGLFWRLYWQQRNAMNVEAT